jgi:hypothetical protein
MGNAAAGAVAVTANAAGMPAGGHAGPTARPPVHPLQGHASRHPTTRRTPQVSTITRHSHE